ncbi:MAG: hypothetical protein ACYTFW_06100 [Planctomycetota bacterium]|jgi:hypothetical protein
MAGKLKATIVFASVAVLIYLVSSVGISAAEDTETAAQGQFADVTISVEASVVRVGLEALEKISGEPVGRTLSSIPIDRIMQCIREEEGGEVVSIVKLAVGNESVAKMTIEESRKEKMKNSGEQAGEYADIKTVTMFVAEAFVKGEEKIVVKLDFKHIVTESTSAASNDAEEMRDIIRTFEVSSALVLQAGQPRVVGATKNEGEAAFLIVYADI